MFFPFLDASSTSWNRPQQFRCWTQHCGKSFKNPGEYSLFPAYMYSIPSVTWSTSVSNNWFGFHGAFIFLLFSWNLFGVILAYFVYRCVSISSVVTFAYPTYLSCNTQIYVSSIADISNNFIALSVSSYSLKSMAFYLYARLIFIICRPMAPAGTVGAGPVFSGGTKGIADCVLYTAGVTVRHKIPRRPLPRWEWMLAALVFNYNCTSANV